MSEALRDVLAGAGFSGILAWIGASVAWAFRTHARISVVENEQKLSSEWLSRVESKLDRVIEKKH